MSGKGYPYYELFCDCTYQKIYSNSEFSPNQLNIDELTNLSKFYFKLFVQRVLLTLFLIYRNSRPISVHNGLLKIYIVQGKESFCSVTLIYLFKFVHQLL